MVANFPHRAPDHQLAHGDLIWDIYGRDPQKPCTRSTRTKPIMILRATRGHNRATRWWIYKQGQRLGHGGQEKKNCGTRSGGKRRKIAFNSLHAKSTWSKWRTSTGHCRNSLPSQPCKKLQCNSRPRRPCRPQGHRVRGIIRRGNANAYMKFLNNSVWMLRRPMTGRNKWVLDRRLDFGLSWLRSGHQLRRNAGFHGLNSPSSTWPSRATTLHTRGRPNVEGLWWHPQRGEKAAGKAFPWLMTSMCQRPTDTLRIVTTCTAWRIDPALIEQCDSVITNILPTTAVSSTAFRTPITREHTHTHKTMTGQLYTRMNGQVRHGSRA